MDAAAQSGNTVVWADDPGGLAVGHPGEWLLVNTSTDQTVTAKVTDTVIGVRPAAGDKFAVITATSDGNAEVLAVSADGSIDPLGTIPTNGASPADGIMPGAASVAEQGDALYVAVGVPKQAGFPYQPSLARVRDGRTTPLPNPPGYGPITFTDAGALVITVPSDGRVAGPQDNRWISSDQGATWRSVSIPPGDFATVRILLGISETSALAFDGTTPQHLGVAGADGTVSGVIDEPEESDGWLVVGGQPGSQATLIGTLSGLGIVVDRATGAQTQPTRQVFSNAHGRLVDAWLGSDGAIHALGDDAACSGACQPSVIVDGLVLAPPTGVGGCNWQGAVKTDEGAMGSRYTQISLINAGSQACPVPHVAGVTGITSSGAKVPAEEDDQGGGLMPPAPANVAPGQAVQVIVVTNTSADLCAQPSRPVTRLAIDIGGEVDVALPSDLDTGCTFSYTQPGAAQ